MADKYDNLISDTDTFDNVVVLEDEEGNKIEFEILDMIEYMGNHFAALLPTAEGLNNEVIFMHYDGIENGIENLSTVEDNAVIDALYDTLKEHYKGVLEFEDREDPIN